MTRVRERGSASVVGYIVVGVILAVIVVGGVYVAKHQLAAHFSKPNNGSTVVTVDGDQNASIDTTKDSSKKSQTDNNKKENSNKTKDNSSNSTNSTSKSTNEGASSENTSGGSENPLPATGSSGVLGEASALAILTGAGVIFLRSRRG